MVKKKWNRKDTKIRKIIPTNPFSENVNCSNFWPKTNFKAKIPLKKLIIIKKNKDIVISIIKI